MAGLVLLMVVGFLIWQGFERSAAFNREFAALLASGDSRTGLGAFFFGTKSLAGTYRGRVVRIRLQRRREDEHGHVTVAMAATSPFTGRIRRESSWTRIGKRFDLVYDSEVGDPHLDDLYVFTADDSRAFERWIADASVRRAVDALVLERDLSLDIQRAWLAATWQQPTFGRFPGRFDGTKWEGVLDLMDAVADSLEKIPGEPPVRGRAGSS